MEGKKRANTGLSKHSFSGILALGPRLLGNNLVMYHGSSDPYEMQQVSRLRKKLMDTFKGRRNNSPVLFCKSQLVERYICGKL